MCDKCWCSLAPINFKLSFCYLIGRFLVTKNFEFSFCYLFIIHNCLSFLRLIVLVIFIFYVTVKVKTMASNPNSENDDCECQEVYNEMLDTLKNLKDYLEDIVTGTF